jgi:inorganic triphosphatase YgiF
MSMHLADQPQELEVKFHLSDAAQAALAKHPVLPGDYRTVHEITTYFDTPRRDLMRAGATLRVRRQGDRRVQTIKLRNGAGAFGRGEWEWPVKSDAPDPRRLVETPLASMVEAVFEPVFVTDVQRDVRVVQHDNATIEVAIDRGQVRAGDAAEEIRELELELKQGDAQSMYRLAAALHASAPMSLGAESKADRGWRLRTGHPRQAVKHVDVALPADVTMANAFRDIMDGVLAHFMANGPAAASGDIEGVHQMRTAIRRARAALLLFQSHIEPHAAAEFTSALRSLGRIFGEARDWDVFCTDMLDAAEQHGIAPSLLDLLRQPAEAERVAAHARVTAELDAPLLTATVLGLAQWELASDTPLVDLAPDLLARLDHKVRHRGHHIARLDDEELHKLRKSLKKLRYSVEFLAPLLPENDVKAYLHRCKTLLKQLGALNDGVVAVALAEQLGGERKPELAPAVAALAEWSVSHRSALRQRIEEDWGKLQDKQLPH